MLEERYAIYCFSLDKTFFCPVGYPENGDKPFSEIIIFSAWVQNVIINNNGNLPENFNIQPKNFKPKILSYSSLQEINNLLPMRGLEDNVFIVLMPEFQGLVDLNVLELVLHHRYSKYMKENGIVSIREKMESKSQINISSLSANSVQVGNGNVMNISISAEKFASALSSLAEKPVEERKSIVEKITSAVAAGATVAEAVSTLVGLLNL